VETSKPKVEELEKENEELKRRVEALESLLGEEDKEPKEIENPYTVTNRALSELVKPKDTMFYLTGGEISVVLAAHEFAKLPTYFGEEPVTELSLYAEELKRHLVSKGGRGRRDVLRMLRFGSGQSRENVNKSLFKQMFNHGKEHDDDEEE
jgi:hypothetical protein